MNMDGNNITGTKMLTRIMKNQRIETYFIDYRLHEYIYAKY